LSNKVGIIQNLFHCVFNALEGTIEHHYHKPDTKLYHSLPNLYLICIASSQSGHRKIEGAVSIKTTRSHDEPGFNEAVRDLIITLKEFSHIVNAEFSILPAKISIDGPPLSDKELINLATKQYMKFTAKN